MLSDIILTQWRHPVASSEALDILHWAMCAVTYRRIAMAIKTATFLGVFVDCCLFACCPGSRWGPSLLTSSSLGDSVFAALDQQWRWDGNGAAVVNKAGRTAVDRDKCDGATHCDDNNNHPYPVVTDIVIIWRLRLRGDGMMTAVVGWQQGGKDRGSGHSPAVGRGS
jgi:hypothetical protein